MIEMDALIVQEEKFASIEQAKQRERDIAEQVKSSPSEPGIVIHDLNPSTIHARVNNNERIGISLNVEVEYEAFQGFIERIEKGQVLPGKSVPTEGRPDIARMVITTTWPEGSVTVQLANTKEDLEARNWISPPIEARAAKMTRSYVVYVPSTCWITETDLNFVFDYDGVENTLKIPWKSDNEEEQIQWDNALKALFERNQRLGHHPPLGMFAPEGNLSISPVLERVKLPQTKKRQIRSPETIKAPSSEAMKDLTTALIRGDEGEWKQNTDGSSVYTQHGDTQVAIKCSPDIGFTPEKVIEAVTKLGVEVVQTFLAMGALWLEQNAGKDKETYLTVNAADLLRFQGRVEKPKGGYQNEDIQNKGRQVALLQNMSVPMGYRTIYNKKKKAVRETIVIEQLVVIKSITLQRTLDASDPESIVTFRYHLGDHVYDWLAGERKQYQTMSAKILKYHPEREKLHILLGFCLTYHDRVNQKKKVENTRKISLPALLRSAHIDIPNRNQARFLESVKKALNDLRDDEVVSGLTLTLPTDLCLSARQIIEKGEISFPRMTGAIAD